MSFDVKKHLIKVQNGKEYLPVAARLVWFRQEHPDWGIETRPVELDIEKGYAIFEATVYNAEGKLMAKGTKMEFFPKVVSEPVIRKDGTLVEKTSVVGFFDYVEKAETGSIGRALALCGFGTQFAPELDEGERIVDSPLPIGEPSMAGSKSGSSAPRSDRSRYTCTNPNCGRDITRGQYEYSLRAFASALCPLCQRQQTKAK